MRIRRKFSALTKEKRWKIVDRASGVARRDRYWFRGTAYEDMRFWQGVALDMNHPTKYELERS